MFSRASAQKRANIVPPIIVAPSGQFDGNDGSWSSFTIRVGNPAQNSRVLVSTLVPETWVVIAGACNAGANSNTNCTKTRGGNPNLFDSSESTTWEPQKTLSFAVEGQLGVPNTEGANYAYDTLGLTTISTSPIVLDHQVLGGMASTYFWLGNLGISPRMPNFQANNSQPGLLGSLYNANKIPSLSYSYTAGAFYRGKTNASLTLGGYDSNRFKNPGVSFDVSSDEKRDLVVGLQSISYSDNSGKKSSVMDSGILSLIDSTLPNIWLPQSACDSMASAFGLTFDGYHSQYVINDTQRMTNYQNGASVNFVLGETISGGSTVSINLPYAAFDLNFTNPTSNNPNATSYFPMKVATDASQYTLGRAFLQEAVLTVDYGRKNFTVAQALPVTSTTAANVIPITNGTSTGGSGSNGSGSSGSSSGSGGSSDGGSSSSGGISGGAIGGIVVGVVGAALIALAGWFFWRRKQRKAAAAAAAANAEKGSGSENGSGTAHVTQIRETPAKMGHDAGSASPPPVYPGANDYFGAAAKDGITAAGSPGPAVSPPHGNPEMRLNPFTGMAELPSPSSGVQASATVSGPNYHQGYDNGFLSPNAGPAGAARIPVAELVGSDPGAMPRELHSPASRSELASPAPRSELESSEVRQELWTPSPTSVSPSSANRSPNLEAVGAAMAATSPSESGAHHRTQRSSTTLPESMQPPISRTATPGEPDYMSGFSGTTGEVQAIPRLPANASTNITAAELAERPMSSTTFFSETPMTPSPGTEHPPRGFFSPGGVSSVGSDGGISRNPSIMSATSVAISGTGRANVVHNRRGSDPRNNAGGIETIGEDTAGERDSEGQTGHGGENNPPRGLFQ